MEHKLKILPIYFNEVFNGNKNFEIRKDDRDYKIGDVLILEEFDNGKYTGSFCRRKIMYILKDAEQYGLQKGYVILSIA